jgi:hypothetical protein
MSRRLEFDRLDSDPSTPPPPNPDTTMWHYAALVGSGLITWATITHPPIQPAGYVFAGLSFGVALFGGEVRRGCAQVIRWGLAYPQVPSAAALLAAGWITCGRWGAIGGAAASAGAMLGWSHLRALRFREPSKAVKEELPDEWLTSLDDRHPAAAAAAGLVHPDDPARVLPTTGPAELNGVGGALIEVDCHAIDSEPGDVRRALTTYRKRMRAPYAYVGGEDDGSSQFAQIHLYQRHPLREPIPWRLLATYARDAGDDTEWVPLGPTAVALPAWARARYSTLVTGTTDSGKGGVILAALAGAAAVRLPVALLAVDNKGAQGGNEWRLLTEMAAGYVQTAADCWPLIRCALDVMADRYARVLRDGAKLRPSDRHPMVWLTVAELWNLLQSRPPSTVKDWSAYTGDRLTAKPSVGEWRSLLDDSLTVIAREGQAAGVAFWGAVQAAQMDAFGKGSRLRTVIPQRLVGRVMSTDDIEPALGSTQYRPPAEEIPETQPGTFYLRRGSGHPELFRAAHVGSDIQRAIVQPMRRLGAQDWIRSVQPFIIDQ